MPQPGAPRKGGLKIFYPCDSGDTRSQQHFWRVRMPPHSTEAIHGPIAVVISKVYGHMRKGCDGIPQPLCNRLRTKGVVLPGRNWVDDGSNFWKCSPGARLGGADFRVGGGRRKRLGDRKNGPAQGVIQASRQGVATN